MVHVNDNDDQHRQEVLVNDGANEDDDDVEEVFVHGSYNDDRDVRDVFVHGWKQLERLLVHCNNNDDNMVEKCS